MIIWLFVITVVAIPICLVLTVAHLTVWRRLGRRRWPLFASLFGVLSIVAVLANPFLNYIIFQPFFGGGVHKMLADLKKESFVGKTRAELIERFGKPDRITPGVNSDQELFFDCHPWFAYSYPEAVVVRVTEDKVENFTYYH